VFDVGVDGGSQRAGADTDDTADKGEQDGFGEELDADMVSGGAEGAS
jgi:hypothetical protein